MYKVNGQTTGGSAYGCTFPTKSALIDFIVNLEMVDEEVMEIKLVKEKIEDIKD